MAVRSVTNDERKFPNTQIATWSGLLNGDTGEPLSSPHYNDKTVQILGALGVGGAVAIKGSNDGVTWQTLTDTLGNALTFTALGAIKSITESPVFIRPEVTAGDGATGFIIIISGTKGSR